MTAKRSLVGVGVVTATVAAFVAVRTVTQTQVTAGPSYYVDAGNGSDTNPGTLAAPWKTLAKANAVVQPGTTIVLSGTFTKQVLFPARSGTAADPIIYRASANGATLDQPGLVGTIPYVVYMGARSYVTVDGLAITNSNYVAAPVANKGVVLRSANHITLTGCTFTHMQMQLIGSDDNTIVGNTWRDYVGSYLNPATGQPDPNHPVSSGDMLNVVLGSDRNTIQSNDMKYAGHSLIEIGNGTGNSEQNAANVIADNTLSNPWYKPLILSDDGAGTTATRNLISDATSVPTLWSTITPGTKEDASAGLQISGEGFTVRANTFTNNVADYGVLSLGSRVYNATKIESLNNVIADNVFTGNHAASSISFVLFQSAADAQAGRAIPSLTGNSFSGNAYFGNSGTAKSWNRSTLYTTFLMHAAVAAPPWPAGGYGGNMVRGDSVDAATNANLVDVTYQGKTIHTVQTLTQWEAGASADVSGNAVYAAPPPPPTTTVTTTTVPTTTVPTTPTTPTPPSGVDQLADLQHAHARMGAGRRRGRLRVQARRRPRLEYLESGGLVGEVRQEVPPAHLRCRGGRRGCRRFGGLPVTERSAA